ncbi:TlpA family protein disulfide reductase [Psychroserpens sp. XS_ASV72]|uniref:TlpA family protein disulfide reductase n=1 Tax=Psychroserpens sp. XS_ASV72 TaxID=3241293 RepID=UPI003519A949
MKHFAFITFLAFVLVSCGNTDSAKGNYAYFGGEIINPSNNYVTLSRVSGGKDTIYLDDNNRFVHKVDNLQPGLYTFTHGGEYQMILLEPKDSLLFRLNTNDFDESLVFTGIGSKKNNYFIQSFLDNEAENKEFRKTSHFEPEVFVEHMDKLRERKLEYLDEFLSKKSGTDLFKTIATNSINYNYYAYHEMYPFGYYGNKQLIHFKDLPEGFYDFRKDVDLNDESLKELYVYNRFLFWHFNNLALKEYYQEGRHHTFDRMALDYNIEKLRLVDSSLTNSTIKNYLLKHITRDFVLNSDDQDETNEIADFYLKKSTNTDDKTELQNLVVRVNNLRPGNIIPDTELISIDGTKTNLINLIDSPTVFYCWSSNFKLHSRNSHYKIKKLKSEFPNINFVAINFNDNDFKYWKKTVRSLNYPTIKEYKFSNPNEAIDTYVITFTHKIFIVNGGGQIVNSNVSLFSDDIYDYLNKLNSRTFKKRSITK